MNNMRAVAVGAAVLGVWVCGALVRGQQTAKQPVAPGRFLSRLALTETSRDSRQTGVNIVRLINTAEMNYKHAHGNYATWDELFRSGVISEREKPATPFQGLRLTGGPEVVPGWALNLVTTAKGQAYALSLRHLTDTCGFSFFSDEHGIIYQGGVIDCAVDLRPPS